MFDEIKEETKEEPKIPEEIPVLPIRDLVIFPHTIVPLFVGREKSIKAVDEAVAHGRFILLIAQKNAEIDDPKPEDLYEFGTIGIILRLLKIPDGKVKILVQGVKRAKITEFLQTDPFFKAKVEQIEEKEKTPDTLEMEALARSVKNQLKEAVSLGKMILPDIVIAATSTEDMGRLADLVASNLSLKVKEAQEVLEIIDPEERLKKVNELLAKELDLLAIQHKIQTQAREEIDKDQRRYFLRQQLKAIQQELGELDEKTEEIRELEEKIKKAKMPEEAEKEAMKQLRRLEKMHMESAEATVIRTYIEWLVELPWSVQTEDNLDIDRVAKILDEDHYNLEKAKERILEYLAVKKLKKKSKGPILCFVGPPGVGKTSLGKSIARALGRKFVRISLGGIRDEAEIRGHRRTYIGAMPGRIIQGIKQAGTNNPVFMLDEIDKVGADFRGDPSAALLEVLDPEQNHSFSDHYIGLPFDLSNVMFIATANILDTILPALRDRMEIIHLPGYTEEEKVQIAKRYLIPRQMEENGITKDHLEITDNAIMKIITQYTREAGLRNLEREIATVCRKVAKKVASGKKTKTKVTEANLHQFLGPPKFIPEAEIEKDEVGVATGLAWTQTGGEIIHVEATTMKGKGDLILTGHLGDVMKESAQAALSYARANAEKFGIDPEIFSKLDIHIHVPAGAIPKDGPSAGITMATALISALTNTPVNKKVAMTGEITLRGKVLPVGGLKEKILAAKRAGIKIVILPHDNEKDLIEIPKYVKRKLEFKLVKTVDEVLEVALLKSKKLEEELEHVSYS